MSIIPISFSGSSVGDGSNLYSTALQGKKSANEALNRAFSILNHTGQKVGEQAMASAWAEAIALGKSPNEALLLAANNRNSFTSTEAINNLYRFSTVEKENLRAEAQANRIALNWEGANKAAKYNLSDQQALSNLDRKAYTANAKAAMQADPITQKYINLSNLGAALDKHNTSLADTAFKNANAKKLNQEEQLATIMAMYKLDLAKTNNPQVSSSNVGAALGMSPDQVNLLLANSPVGKEVLKGVADEAGLSAFALKQQLNRVSEEELKENNYTEEEYDRLSSSESKDSLDKAKKEEIKEANASFIQKAIKDIDYSLQGSMSSVLIDLDEIRQVNQLKDDLKKVKSVKDLALFKEKYSNAKEFASTKDSVINLLNNLEYNPYIGGLIYNGEDQHSVFKSFGSKLNSKGYQRNKAYIAEQDANLRSDYSSLQERAGKIRNLIPYLSGSEKQQALSAYAELNNKAEQIKEQTTSRYITELGELESSLRVKQLMDTFGNASDTPSVINQILESSKLNVSKDTVESFTKNFIATKSNVIDKIKSMNAKGKTNLSVDSKYVNTAIAKLVLEHSQAITDPWSWFPNTMGLNDISANDVIEEALLLQNADQQLKFDRAKSAKQIIDLFNYYNSLQQQARN